MSRLVFFTSGVTPPPAPDFLTLPPDPEHPGARLVPANGWVSIEGAEWHLSDIRSFVVCGDCPRPVAFTGPRPTLTCPPRVDSIHCTFTIGTAPASVIEEADEPPIVSSGFGPARWGRA